MLVLAYLAGLVPGFLMALQQPVWGRVDEAQHYDFAAQLAHGVYPVEGVTTLRPETVAIMKRTGVYQWSLAGARPAPAVTDPAAFTPPPAGLSAPIREVWLRNHLWWFSYEAMQPPFYYLLATPFWLAGHALGGNLGALYAVRLLDAAILALLAPLTLAAGWVLLPGRRAAAAAAALLAALVPGLALNGSAITNDGLATVLGAAVLLVAATGYRRGWTPRLAALAGLLMGLAVLTKLTTVALAPMLALALLRPWTGWRPARLGRLLPAAIAAAAGVLVLLPWLALDERLYGHPTAQAQVAELMGATFRPVAPTPGFLAGSAANAFVTFWSGEPLGTLPAVAAITSAALLLCGAGAVGVQRLLRDPARRRAERALLLLAGTGAAGAAATCFMAVSMAGLGAYAPGRYAYPGLAPLALLLVAGMAEVVVADLWRIFAVAAAVTVACLNLGGYALGFSGTPEPEGSWMPAQTAGANVVDGSGSFGPVTIRADRETVDPRGTVWLHVIATNAGDQPAEWWPIPFLELGGKSYQADYSAGSWFSQGLPAGGSENGWIAFKAVPAAALRRKPVGVEFYGVTLNGWTEQAPILFGLPPLT